MNRKNIPLVAVIGLIWCAPASSRAEAGPSSVEVPASMRACKVDAECGRVETSCSGCCRDVGINKKYEAEYEGSFFNPGCATYSGPVCRCTRSDSTPACIKGVCELVPRASTPKAGKR